MAASTRWIPRLGVVALCVLALGVLFKWMSLRWDTNPAAKEGHLFERDHVCEGMDQGLGYVHPLGARRVPQFMPFVRSRIDFSFNAERGIATMQRVKRCAGHETVWASRDSVRREFSYSTPEGNYHIVRHRRLGAWMYDVTLPDGRKVQAPKGDDPSDEMSLRVLPAHHQLVNFDLFTTPGAYGMTFWVYDYVRNREMLFRVLDGVFFEVDPGQSKELMPALDRQWVQDDKGGWISGKPRNKGPR